MKKEFTKRWLACGAVKSEVSAARQKEGRRGVWQPRYWEHTIRDEHDFEHHLEYIHYNPVLHTMPQIVLFLVVHCTICGHQ